jgi:hypothetical protein
MGDKIVVSVRIRPLSDSEKEIGSAWFTDANTISLQRQVELVLCIPHQSRLYLFVPLFLYLKKVVKRRTALE